jgi:molybdopterin molybdotransferase
MITVEKALEIILSNSPIMEKSEKIDLFNCHGRTLFKDTVADYNVPPENNSAMDGYAILTADTASAGKNNPVSLKIIDEVQAGYKFNGEKLQSGSAIRIMTGAPIPEGADSVIPFEDTQESENIVKVFKKTAIHENIRFAGEDIKKGNIVLKSGTRIDSAEIGLLSSINMKEIEVYKKPEVGIISTGDELAEPGSVNSGKIINSNAYVLYSEVKKYGGNPIYGGIVKDNYQDVKNCFLKMMDNDIIISSGGVSMGRYDFIPDVLKELGIDIKIEKVKMKPGKPIVFGTIDKKIFFGLPGNPVSVMVSFMQFVRPAILKITGNDKITKPLIKAITTEIITKKKGRKHFIRGIFHIENGKIFVSTTGPQGSGMLTSMSSANCLIIVPEEIDLIKSGELVDIQLTGHSEI